MAEQPLAVTPDEVEKFYTQTVPAFVKWWTQKEGRPPAECRAEIWTTGRLGRAARGKLAELQLKGTVRPQMHDRAGVVGLLPWELEGRGTSMVSAISRGGEDDDT